MNKQYSYQVLINMQLEFNEELGKSRIVAAQTEFVNGTETELVETDGNLEKAQMYACVGGLSSVIVAMDRLNIQSTANSIEVVDKTLKRLLFAASESFVDNKRVEI